jgi:hypothetical protein
MNVDWHVLADELARSVRELVAPHKAHVCWPAHSSARCPVGRARDRLADFEMAGLDDRPKEVHEA